MSQTRTSQTRASQTCASQTPTQTRPNGQSQSTTAAQRSAAAIEKYKRELDAYPPAAVFYEPVNFSTHKGKHKSVKEYLAEEAAKEQALSEPKCTVSSDKK